MKVTIITASYNRKGTIGEAIHSVLEQDYPNLEYIIMDGASTDRSVEYIKDFLKHEATAGSTELIRRHALETKFFSEPDHGMYEALNKGMRLATGDVIGLVHSDDALISNRIVSEYVKCFDLTAADLVYGDGEFVDEKNPSKVMRLWVSGSYRRWKVRLGWLPLHPTVYIRRAALSPEVLYDEQYRMAADTKFLIYYLHEYPLRICYLPQNVIRMRMGGLSTNPKHRRRMFLEDVKIYGDYGFSHPNLIKLMKMSWKVPQFINAILRRLHIPLSI